MTGTMTLAQTLLNSEYLFEWIAHNWMFYVGLCVIAYLPLLFDKQYVSILMTDGIVVGIFVGNYVGAFIRDINISKITDQSSAEEIYRLQHHPGFEIWMGCIVVGIILGVIVQKRFGKRDKTNKEW